MEMIGPDVSNAFAVQPWTIPDVAHAQAIAEGSFNGDSYPDLAVLDGTDGSVSVLLSGGTSTFTTAPGSPVSAVGSGTAFGLSVATGTFGSGSDAGVAVGFDDGQVSVLLGDGAGGLTGWRPGVRFRR